jgi:hypothetical protein
MARANHGRLYLLAGSLSASLICATPGVGQDVDGEILLNDTTPTDDIIPPPAATFGPYGEGDAFVSSRPSIDKAINVYNRVLARWRDPLTLPHTRSQCVKWASGNWPWGGGWKTCIGWKTQFQWLDNTLTLIISTEAFGLAEIQKASNDCLATGAVAAALTAYVTSSGATAIATFKEVFVSCLAVKLPATTLKVDLPVTSRWSNWQ